MTTLYHTPYSTGGPLTAAAMNAPLGQLDAAIGNATGAGVNVKAYGAVGTDTTDDDTAINNAIVAVNAAGGGVVFVPEGTYRCAASIVLRSNVILRGEGYGSILKLKASTVADVIKCSATSAATAIGFAGVENLTIDGNKANQTANNDAQQYGISLNSASDCWVTNCWIKNTKRSGIYFAGARNRAENNYLTGIGAVGAASSIIGRQGIQFDNFNLTEIVAHRSIARGNRVIDCLEHGIKVYDGSTGSIIADNIVQAAGDKGIEIMGCTYSAVTGNTVNGATGGGITVGDSTHAGIGNVVSGNTVNGILTLLFTANGIMVHNQTGTIVSGNGVTGCRGHGIFVYDAPASIITGNRCAVNGLDGGYSGIALYQSPESVVTGNTCSNNGTTGNRGNGIKLYDGAGAACTDCVVSNNRCYDSGSGTAKVQAYGILAADDSNYLTVAGNALRGNFTATHSLVGANNVYTAGAV